MYKEITQEQQAQIKDLFVFSNYDNVKFEFEVKSDGYYITAKREYEYVEFKDSVLVSYVKIADILGCANGDEVDRHYTPGCETCDFGSEYIIELRFW